MKLFWKMFFSIISIVTILFSTFGGWLLYATFNNSLDREMSRGNSENRMFLYAFEASLEMLPDYKDKDEEVKTIVDTIKENIGQNQYYVKIYNGSGDVIYRDTELTSSVTPEKIKDGTYAYTVNNKDGRHYLEMMMCVNDSLDTYYINIMRDIQYIYDDRQETGRQYGIAVVILLCVSGILSYVLSRVITKPIVSLSNTVQNMAKGNYKLRAEIKATGEVGKLVDNFNLMAEQLEENISELEDAARKQEDFTASFAHELKTPLTSIVGYSDMLRSMNLKEKEIQEYANYIFLQGKRLENLSYSLMDLITLDKQDINLVKINVKKLCATVKNMVVPALRSKSLYFKVDIEEGYIQGDNVLLISLLNNLIDNARKAVSENGMIILQGRKNKEGYMLLVQDNGCGMEESEVKKITEAFYMIDKSRARKEGGAGIGMALCKKIVQLHNAKWYIKSEPGKGTSVYVVFPDMDEVNKI